MEGDRVSQCSWWRTSGVLSGGGGKRERREEREGKRETAGFVKEKL